MVIDPVIDALEIENFRGIDSGKISGLAPLSILVGPNNSGKSTILESMWIAAGCGKVRRFVEVLKRRAWLTTHGLRYMFYDEPREAVFQVRSPANSSRPLPEKTMACVPLATSKACYDLAAGEGLARPIEQLHVECESEDGRSQSSDTVIDQQGRVATDTLKGKFEPRPESVFLACQSIHEHGTLEDAYSSAVSAGFGLELIALTKPLRHGMKDLRILKDGDLFNVHIVEATRSSPLYFAGDGFKRLVHVACQLAHVPGGLALVEEPECFQHPKSISSLARLFWAAVDRGTQIVMSTHSLELIEALMREGEANLFGERLAVFKTSLIGGKLEVVKIPGDEAHERLQEVGEDLRR